MKVVINSIRLGLLMPLVCKVTLRGDIGGSSYLFGDEGTVVTPFKVSSASIERGFGRTDTS